jgi:hypothetical protein
MDMIRRMRQDLVKVRLGIHLHNRTLRISLAIDSAVGSGRVEAFGVFAKSVSEIGLRSVQLMAHARRIFARVVDRVTINIIVEISTNLGKVLSGIVVRVAVRDTGIGGNGLGPDIAVGKGEVVSVVAVHGLVREPRLGWVTAAEDVVAVRVATAASEPVHGHYVEDVAASSWRYGGHTVDGLLGTEFRVGATAQDPGIAARTVFVSDIPDFQVAELTLRSRVRIADGLSGFVVAILGIFACRPLGSGSFDYRWYAGRVCGEGVEVVQECNLAERCIIPLGEMAASSGNDMSLNAREKNAGDPEHGGELNHGEKE